MKVFKRLYTLWVLSSIDLGTPEKKKSFISTLKSLLRPNMAIIVEQDEVLDSVKL